MPHRILPKLLHMSISNLIKNSAKNYLNLNQLVNQMASLHGVIITNSDRWQYVQEALHFMLASLIKNLAFISIN